MKHNVPIQSLIDHIKTAIDVDPWAKEMVEELLKEQEVKEQISDAIHETAKPFRRQIVMCKDCKHGSLYCTEDVCGETLIECNRPDLGDVIEIHGWKWFCADGERRDKDA